MMAMVFAHTRNLTQLVDDDLGREQDREHAWIIESLFAGH
jgi:hypothetical protein